MSIEDVVTEIRKFVKFGKQAQGKLSTKMKVFWYTW